MNRDKQKQIFDAFVSKQWDIMDSKAKDYANDDRLSNFKRVASMCGTSPEVAIMHLIATKVARLTELFSGKTPNNESVEDSILDLANYTILLQMAREEGKAVTDVPKSAFTGIEKVRATKNEIPIQSPERIYPTFGEYLKSLPSLDGPMTAKPPQWNWEKLTDVNKDGGRCYPEDTVMPKAKLKKKKKASRFDIYKKEDGVKTFKASSMEDALSQLEKMGIKVPNGMMLGCMQVK